MGIGDISTTDLEFKPSPLKVFFVTSNFHTAFGV